MQVNNILYLSDRILVADDSIPESLLFEMRKIGILAPDMVKIHYCGVISYCDGLAVFLPRNHGAKIEERPSAANLLLQALLKYYQNKDSGIYSQEGGEEVIGGKAFSLAVSLLNDYRANSLYVHRVKERLSNNGKVNWPRTIACSTAYPAQSGLMYLDLSTSRSRYISNCETAKIHAQIIKELLNDYGILWLGLPSLFDERLELIPKPSGNVDVQIAYLQRELQMSYSDRDMFLIKSLIQYLRNKKGINTNNVLIGVRKFHNIWESMLDECLVGKYVMNSKLPIPVYQTVNDEFVPVAQKGQRTDTVLKHPSECRFAVVDAKYYEASSAGTAPGWSDLVKQFFYQKAVLDVEGEGTLVSNHFIFPGNSNQLKAAHVANRDVMIESPEDCIRSYSVIHCHYQPPIDLLSAYVNNEKLTDLTDHIWMHNNKITI